MCSGYPPANHSCRTCELGGQGCLKTKISRARLADGTIIYTGNAICAVKFSMESLSE